MFGPIFKRHMSITMAPPSAVSLQIEAKVLTSHALPRLARRLRAASHPRVLDLGNVVGSNIQFLIDLGCKVTADDLLRPVETVFSDNGGGPPGWKAPALRRLDYPEGSFDAVLSWDLYDFLGAPEARALSSELHRLMKPGGIVMAYFTSRQTERRDPSRRYRILDQNRIEWASLASTRAMRHVYQNRDIEKMFEGFRIHTAVFLQNGSREILLEKKMHASLLAAPAAPAAG